MSASPKMLITPEQYLELDRAAQERSQFYQGEMFAMAGGTKNHNQIIQNIAFGLRESFRRNGKPCRTYITDLRVRVDAKRLYSYPDVVAVCGKPEFLDGREDTLLNPVVVFEVLSDSTEAFDRGKKFDLYLQVESLQEYILVSQKEARVDHFVRQVNGSWSLFPQHGMEAELVLQALDVKLPFREIYLDVEFPPEEPPPADGIMRAPGT